MKKYLLFFLLIFSSALFAQESKNHSILQKGVTVASNVEKKDTSNTYAIIIGISDYEYIDKLRFAHRDAEAFADYLMSPAGGSVPRSNVFLLTNKEATHGNIWKTLEDVGELLKSSDKFIFYFSGHGDVSNKLTRTTFLLAQNTSRNSYNGQALSLTDLQEILIRLGTELNIKTYVFIDACRAGKLAGNDKRGTEITGIELQKLYNNGIRFLACQPDEFSYEGEQWGGGRGLFSYYLIRGLQGLADGTIEEKPADGVVSLEELYDYIRKNVRRETASEKLNQIPQKDGKETVDMSFVHKPTLLALKNSYPAPSYSTLTGKGFVEDVISKSNALTQQNYKYFQLAVATIDTSQRHFEKTKKYYEQLLLDETISKAHPFIKRELVANLLDDSQTYFNALLESEQITTFFTKTKKKEAPDNASILKKLVLAKQILGETHPFSKSIQTRILFLKSRNIKTADERIRILDEALKIDSTAAYLYIYKALAIQDSFENKDRTNEIECKFSKSLINLGLKAYKFSPKYYYAIFLIASCYMNAAANCNFNEDDKNYEISKNILSNEGVKYCDEAINLRPERYEAYFVKGAIESLLLENEKLSEQNFAIADSLLNPKDAIILRFMGLSTEVFSYKKSLKYYQKSYEADSTNIDNLESLSDCLFNLGKGYYAEAIKFHEKWTNIIEINIDIVKSKKEYFKNFGKAYFFVKDYEQSISYLDILSKIDTIDYEISGYLGASYAEKKDFKQAEIVYKKYLKKDSSNVFFNLDLGNVLYNQEKFNEASISYQKVISINPKNPYVYHQLAYIAAINKKYSEAENYYLSCLKYDDKKENTLSAQYNIACIYSIKNDIKTSLKWLEDSLKSGYNDFEHIKVDSDFDNIRQTPEFKALIQKYFPEKK